MSRGPSRVSAVLRPALLLAAALALGLAACATPVAPSGGPADTTPPALVRAFPADGATNVTDGQVTLTFSERLGPAAARAVRVTPEPAVPPRVSVRGRDLVVTIDDLRDSTTYVVSVGTELADTRSVALRAPIAVAFATGSQIDRGRIEGTVRDPATGDPVRALAVWAYALADSLSADTTAGRAPGEPGPVPDYRTETAADGAFRLDYLRPGLYAVAAVEDRNRNGRADAGEPFAVSPTRALRAVATDTSGAASDSLGAPPRPALAPPSPAGFFTTRLDTFPPVPRAVRVLSDRRVAVRFSEAVRLVDRAAFAFEDSTSGRTVAASAYVLPEALAEVVVVAAGPLGAVPLRVRGAAGAVADSSGVPAAAFARTFTPAARADTVAARFRGFEPPGDSARVLVPGERAVLRFTVPPDTSALAARVRVTNAAGAAVPARFETEDGVRIGLVLPDGAAGAFTVVAEGDTAQYTVLGPDALGAVVGRVADAAGRAVVVEAVPDGQPLAAPSPTGFGPDAARAVAGPDGRFEIAGLRPGPYRLRLFADLDGDGRWSGGRLAPYAPPEPLAFVEAPAAVRARWEADVDDILLAPGSPGEPP